MPTYQYACTECGGQVEALQKFSDEPLTVHEACGGKLRKVFSPVGIVFKGSGFYRTDSRSGSAAPAAAASSDSGTSDSGTSDSKAASPASSSGDSGSSAASSSDSGSKADSKPGGKPEAKSGSKSSEKVA